MKKLLFLLFILSIFLFTGLVPYINNRRICPVAEKYTDMHIEKYVHTCVETNIVPRVVWVFWFGGNMSSNRKKCLQNMKDTLNVPMIVLTESTIEKYLLWYVHSSVQYLSGNHKSDYYRIYFLLHYGGGYSDIKKMVEPWDKYFDEFKEENVWMIGIPEIKGGVAIKPGNNYPDNYYEKLISNGFMIGRQNNPYLKEVHRRQNEILDTYQTTLTGLITPPGNRCCQNKHHSYPLRWAELMGEITAEVSEEYYTHFLRIMKMPICIDYL